MKRFQVVLLGIGLILFLSSPMAFAGKSNVLRIAFDAADMIDLHPHFAQATQDRGTVQLFFSGLIRYKPGDISEFLPDVAESWENSEDGLTWTFHLRKGVMVHPWKNNPGYELTSEDVVYSFTSAADPARSSRAAEYVGMTFSTDGPYTFVVKLKKPVSQGLFFPKFADYSAGFIIPKKPAEELGEGFRKHPVGTGPFIFKEYLPQEKIITKSNEKFYRGAPKLDGVEVYYMPDLSSRKFGLQSKELDVIEGPPSQPWVDEMKSLPKVAVDIFGPGEQGVIHFNMTMPPLDNIKVRRAIAYAICRDEVSASIGGTIGTPAYSHSQRPQGGWMSKDELVEYGKKDGKDYLYECDKEKAKKLLAEAGFADGITLEFFQTERGEYMVPMQNIQAQLREAGIQAKFKMVDHTTWHNRIRADTCPLVLYNCIRPTTDVRLTHFQNSSSVVKSGKAPITNFSHIGTVDANGDGKVDGIDDLIAAASDELDIEKQNKIWKTAVLKLLDWCSSYPLFVKQWTFARNDKFNWGYNLDTVIFNAPVLNELAYFEK
jgi:peptide/nickel transport system substrate-binding protein